ncbi:MAG TPA: transcriptional regulator [Anaerolineae bacterium]|nr:transcriptional regulator [Anaerolineae bacterium]
MAETDGYEILARLFRAMAHPVRLRILDILSQQEACVCHLTAILDKRQPYVSQQLATLRRAGLITDRREGTLVYYRLTDDHLASLLREGQITVRDLKGEGATFAVPEEVLANCPCPRCQSEG